MCVMSLVMDDWNKRYPTPAPTQWTIPLPVPAVGPTAEEVRELIALLKAAKKYDDATGQPDCEVKAKLERIKQLANELAIAVEGL